MTHGVYLLHFSPAFKHAAHYTGFAYDIERRVAEQQAGIGARLPQVAVEAGCQLILAQVWPGADRKFERRLKNRHGASRFCPICRGEATHPLKFTLEDVPELSF